MDFGARIRSAREQTGMTRDDLAKRLNIQYSALSKYESSAREPDFETLVQIANALRVSTDYILGCTEEQMRLKRKGFDADAESLLLKYQTLSEEAKERIQNQVAFEYAQQRARNQRQRKL
ncbi:MAG: helix-turn-helix transcriptional regulator [Schwartzia succinivorans]|nr:helix-turn-helix transcriptional regulator [Schwartzia succinivorans]